MKLDVAEIPLIILVFESGEMTITAEKISDDIFMAPRMN
jgi:TATA-box binding protein (TBP) (component of TFIID and TFIIIB)